MPIQEEDILQKGSEQVAAGYILYGSSTMLVYTTGKGVNGFTLDPSIGEFCLSHPKMKIPKDGSVYDIIWVHYRRHQAGIRSIRDLLSSTGKDHLPHRLMARGVSKPVCMAVVTFLSVLAAAGVWAIRSGLVLVALMAFVALVAFLWHLEENAQVVIRPEDRVAVFGLRTDSTPLQTSLQHEEGVA